MSGQRNCDLCGLPVANTIKDSEGNCIKQADIEFIIRSDAYHNDEELAFLHRACSNKVAQVIRDFINNEKDTVRRTEI